MRTFQRRAVALLVLVLHTHIYSTAQSPAVLPGPEQTPRFRVAADGVSIDAVVTDRDGRIVADLTTDDFEVRQDGKIQKLLFAQFVPVRPGGDTHSPVPPMEHAIDGRPVAAPVPVRREDVQRTVAIVVDDLGLSVESLQNTQKALHAFVDRELRPTDLATLVRSGGSIGSTQSFTTDRRVLHGAIDNLRWNGSSRSGVEPYQALNIWTTFDKHGSDIADPNDFALVESVRQSMSASGTLGALNLVVRGSRDMPGRKAIIFVSEGFQVLAKGAHDDGAEPDTRVRYALDRLIDQAARAGVVIYSLDCRGLQAAGIQAGDNVKSGALRPDGFDELIRTKGGDRQRFNRDTQEGLAYLAEQTGGFAVLNTNDLSGGLSRITNDLRDYYVIGYTPDDRTFAPNGRKPSLHKISIRVRRPGLLVKTRKEFLGVSDAPETTAAETPAQQLVRAAISPFAATDMAVRATTLPGYSPDQGTFVRTLLHIDARALTFTDSTEGKKTATADVLGMVFDQDGTEVAHLSTGFAVGLTDEGAEDALRDGLAYSLRIPIRRSGAYQVRFAVRDRQSGALGSAGEYLEMPDVAGGAFALSGIVLRREQGAVTTLSDGTTPALLSPDQAVRVYSPGAQLSYAYEIYNAVGPVQAALSIWRGNDKVLVVPPNTLVPPSGERVFAARGGVKLGEALAPGNYVLRIAATTPDPKREGKNNTAVRSTDFDVR